MHRTRLAALLGLGALALVATEATAQRLIDTPWVSPSATARQTIGLTDVTVEYHRPAVKERTIWGGLVPYDQVWRAGANDNTTIELEHDVMIEGKLLAAGTYGLHMMPSAADWIVIFSKNSTSWGSFTYDEAEDALRVTVKPRSAAFQERLSYRFDDLENESATLVLHWEKLEVPVAIGVDTKQLTLASIRKELRHLPRFSWQAWQQAANYCLLNDVNLDEAMTWIDESIRRSETAQNLNTKAGLLRKTGKDEEAFEMVTKALAIGTERQINVMGYQLLGADQHDRAIEVFQANTKRFPESWNALDSLAEAFAKAGQAKEAVKHYQKALEMAPEAQRERIKGALADLGADKSAALH